MKKLLLAILAAALLSSPALADWTGKDASGNTITFKNSGVCTSVVCVPIAQPVDSTGAAFGVTGNPIFMSFGTGVTLPAFAATPTVNLGTLNGAATAAKQPALGTAGTPSTDVITIQGAASMTPVAQNLTQIGGAAPSATNPIWTATAEATVSAGNTLNAVVANTTGTSVPVTGYGAALVNVNCSVNCTGGTAVNFQASDVVGFQAVGAMPVAGGSAMVTSVVNQSGAAMFCIPNMGYTNMRANVASYSAGTISVTITPINAASCDVAQIANALASVQANNGTNGAANTQTTPTTEQNGTAYPNHGNWASGAGNGTATSAITVISAPGANSLYVKSVQCARDDAGTTAVRVTFNDTSSSVLVLPNNGGGGGNNATFDPPVKVAATTAFTATPSAATTTIRCNAQGFIAP